MRVKRTLAIGSMFVLAFVLVPATVQAYLDPTSASIVYQVAVGSLLALVAAIRLYWKRIVSLLRDGKGSADPDTRTRTGRKQRGAGRNHDSN